MKSREQISKEIFQYYDKISDKVIERLGPLKGKNLNTNKGIYEVIEVLRTNLKEMNFDGKVHDMFSSKGFEISGDITFRASAYSPDSDKNSYTSYCFKIRFNLILVKFNFEKEDFVIEAPIDINYISLEDDWSC